ncbi:MAG: UDP-N-acetylmuramate:L-alanyl-gamma-D-glutamyl-meso-diaminopimelate ligase [Chromatiaceae bacterium]|nr:UDP-N-acetylmuramate:L-alanyl-gamma-D-glutamyl-meso-diaminopimelate ligase [Gammaproteobacteria bacterium]MCP5427610.1 UDP-N-acetylmuramate:L-alanyl-gamma-D-glutamyl-meso-diaminopimelate ligase [Chromatiaceae bacterium]MCP5447553.1 UDP-N-acetylmuramate:L-alanyl-gamma-D-glutamyl-meso-diaminopimelate ligase [Chromatiaceae bacterium]
MRIHILGICGTFMGGLALLARAMGHEVSGSDANVYPPMSTQLEAAGIQLMTGYAPDHLQPAPDCVVVGNAMSRGNPAVEYMLDAGLRYASGPQWLADHVLQGRWVLAVAGTHGKTGTASLLAWILEDAGLAPGFLIGGVPENFGVSARLGDTPFFVVEADEYDTAFFDKRSKFVHYRPRTLILNNLEFDHADIFEDLKMIQRQFHHLVRTVPGSGLIIAPAGAEAMDEMLAMGCWTPLERFSVDDSSVQWRPGNVTPAGEAFDLWVEGRMAGRAAWGLSGRHNISNALAAIAAARHAGVPPQQAIRALSSFHNVKRRMELRGEVEGVRVFDDFAHHPTAIETTLSGLRARVGYGTRIVAILEPRSNTMRMGVLASRLPEALALADEVLVYSPENLKWNAAEVFAPMGKRAAVFDDVAAIVSRVAATARAGDQLLVMSNGGFEGIHQRLLDALTSTGVVSHG